MDAATPLLRTEGLTVAYHSRGAHVVAVQDATITVTAGESVALVGESGSGKTTVARTLLGLLPPRIARIESGRILIEGRDVAASTEDEWERLRGHPIAMVFQDPLSYLNPVMRVGRQIAESVDRHDRAERDVPRRVAELLALVRLPETAVRSYPHELSGGMRQRVVIAMALACGPRLLLQQQLLELWAEERRTVMFITHDLHEAIALGTERAAGEGQSAARGADPETSRAQAPARRRHLSRTADAGR